MDAHDARLTSFLSAHEGVLQPLLGPLWPVWPFKTEQFGPLTKYTLGQMPNGTWAMLHCLTGPDQGPPHCHPCRMDSHIIAGCYWETIYHEDGRTERVLRAAGGHHTIWPHTVHAITDLPQGCAWSLAFGHDVVREWKHYPELLAATSATPATPIPVRLSLVPRASLPLRRRGVGAGGGLALTDLQVRVFKLAEEPAEPLHYDAHG